MPGLDAETRRELETLKNDDEAIRERFRYEIEFGTAGLRGKLGAGSNRMNIYTVRRATQALAHYILQNKGEKAGVAIAYDSRRGSAKFAESAALVLCGNGITTYLYEGMRSVPQLSFTVRKLKCFAGIEITASHNTAEYNGYKVYASYGGQLGNEGCEAIMCQMSRIAAGDQIKECPTRGEAEKSGYLHMIGGELDNEYSTAIRSMALRPELAKEWGDRIKIVYTPLHGTGRQPVQKILTELGYMNIITVTEQEEPDSLFTHAPVPNPGDPRAMELAVKLAREQGANVAIATDPDADRMGCAIRNGEDYKLLTGNQAGCMLLYYLLNTQAEKGIIHEKPYIAKSIVSSNLANAIAQDHGVETREVLTGFRFIAEEIEKSRDGRFLFGFEESAGFMSGDLTRDKDGVWASMMMAEMAVWCMSQGKSMMDLLNEIYEKYGYFLETTKDITLEGTDGMNKIAHAMETLRYNSPLTVGAYIVEAKRDYSTLERADMRGYMMPLFTPKADMIYFELEGGRWACARPSGTEPKLKLYSGVCEKSAAEAEAAVKKLSADLYELVKPALE